MTSTIERSEFATADPARARELVDHIYGIDVRFIAPPDTWQMAFAQIDAGHFGVANVTVPGELGFVVHGRHDVVVIDTLTDGPLGYERGQDASRYLPGDVFIGSAPRAEWPGTVHNCRVQTIMLPVSLLTSVAGHNRSGWDFRAYEPIRGGASRWRKTTQLVNGLLTDRDLAAAPLVIGPAGRLLAATALTVFPNTAIATATIQDSIDAHPDTLHRAITFIEANPDVDIGRTQIAAAARVTPRALQYAFRRHLNTTPLAYLRKVRLDRAHADLLDATPGDGHTVTTIATRWGFVDPSRFAAHHRTTYGETPSNTLYR